jgi:phosphoserine phosphatase
VIPVAIYLVRHGETPWNRRHRLQGIRDLPLNRAGLRQARGLAERFRRLTIASIVTSPLLRARHTALEIRGARPCPVVVEDDLREIDHGGWTGMTMGEIQKRHSEEFLVWQWGPERLQPRTGESLQAVYCRSTRVLRRVLPLGRAQNVVMVSHGVVNALLLCSVFGLPIARVWDFPQANASAYVLRSNGREINRVESLGP